MLPKINKKINEKIRIQFDTVSTNDMGAAFTPFFPSTPKEQTILQEQADQLYEIFLDPVAQTRHMTLDKVNALADGRDRTGSQASKIDHVAEMTCMELTTRK